ncbi:MAG: hypothetical protein FWF58_00525, partial [Firmicutes bacterium]|nr:hypothetical protein [Bacillota bacterium]
GLFFFDAKKEPKKHLGDCESPQTPERFKVDFIYVVSFISSYCTLFVYSFIKQSISMVHSKKTLQYTANML